MRSLSPDEAALWAKVAATIRPLSRDATPAGSEPTIEPAAAKPVAARAPVRSLPKPASRRLEAATLDGSWDRRLRGGEIRPDRVVDLHGFTLDGAWHRIDLELERAIAASERVILLITGHRRPGDPPVERGKIRAAVDDWLAVSRHAGKIAAVRGAHRRHGGGGALYLILRR